MSLDLWIGWAGFVEASWARKGSMGMGRGGEGLVLLHSKL
jgi:hypothetical protein